MSGKDKIMKALRKLKKNIRRGLAPMFCKYGKHRMLVMRYRGDKVVVCLDCNLMEPYSKYEKKNN